MEYFFYFIFINLVIYFIFLIWLIFGIFTVNINNQKSKYSFYPKVSVILCVRNGSNSINNILNDLKLQNYESSIEFIIVDDESTDNTKSVILKYAKSDSRFKYVHSSTGDKLLSYK